MTPHRGITDRKADQLELALRSSLDGPSDPGWGDVRLLPAALPEVDLDDIDLTTSFLGRELAAPIVIAGMTGGHAAAVRINGELAAAARDLGLALGVGSQRAALLDPALRSSYSVVREHAPDAFVIANIGAAQLVTQAAAPALDPGDLDALVDMVSADALAVHLNWLEELVLTTLAAILRPLPDAAGGAALVLVTPASPPALAVLSTAELVLDGSALRVALHATGSAARTLGTCFTVLAPAADCALRVEARTRAVRRAGPLAVVEGVVDRVRPTSEYPWRLELSFSPMERRPDEPTVRYWRALRSWLTAGAVDAVPLWPA